MSTAIMRVEGIKTTSDLRGIGKHNLDRVSATNDDIDPSRSGDNIHLVQSDSYLKNFFKMVEPMKKEHDEKMKTERKDRVKSFESRINTARNDIACEFLFTSDEKFFEGKSKEDIEKWATQSLNFVKNEIGIGEENILHATVHMDEKTPHLHVVAVPLIKKYDGRSKKEIWQINRKHFIKTRDDMSALQENYYQTMKAHGHEFKERAPSKETGRKHVRVEKFKKQTLEKEVRELKGIHENLQTDVKGLTRAVEYAREVEDIEGVKPALFDRKHFRVPVKDFEDLINKAKATEAYAEKTLKYMGIVMEEQNRVTDLTNKNKKLQEENKELKSENRELKVDNQRLADTVESQKNIIKYLQQTLDMIKSNSLKFLEVAVDKMQSYVGKVRGQALFNVFDQEVFQKDVLRETIPSDEKESVQNQINIILEVKKVEEKKQADAEFRREARRKYIEKIERESTEKENRESEKRQEELEKPTKKVEKDDFEIGR